MCCLKKTGLIWLLIHYYYGGDAPPPWARGRADARTDIALGAAARPTTATNGDRPMAFAHLGHGPRASAVADAPWPAGVFAPSTLEVCRACSPLWKSRGRALASWPTVVMRLAINRFAAMALGADAAYRESPGRSALSGVSSEIGSRRPSFFKFAVLVPALRHVRDPTAAATSFQRLRASYGLEELFPRRTTVVVRPCAPPFIILGVFFCRALLLRRPTRETGSWRAGGLDAGWPSAVGCPGSSPRRCGRGAHGDGFVARGWFGRGVRLLLAVRFEIVSSVYPRRGRAATGTRFQRSAWARGRDVASTGTFVFYAGVAPAAASPSASVRLGGVAGRTHSCFSSSKTNFWRLPTPDAIQALFRARTMPPALMN